MEVALRNSWVWLLTELSGAGVTFLNRIASNRTVTYRLDDVCDFVCDVPSDNPAVNRRSVDDEFPYVSHNSRLLYGLRREGGSPPYVCRFGGVATILEDEGTADEPLTHLTAHDPWMWAKSLPVLNPDGSLPGPKGLTYTSKTGDYIAKDVLANAYAWMVSEFGGTSPWSGLPNDGHHYFIDIDSGHYDTTDVIPTMTFEQGLSVGEAWTKLVQTASLDIVLTPIYRPHDQPGVVSVLNVYAQAGEQKPGAVFGYDAFPHNVVAIDRVGDGTQLENWAQYYAGGLSADHQTAFPSIDVYGPYWVQKSYPSPASVAAIDLVAAGELALRKSGKRTISIDPSPERAPDPFTEYFLGDVIPLWGGTPTKGGGYSTRVQYTAGDPDGGGGWTNGHRVYEMPITIGDDEVETVTQLLLADPNE